MTLLMLASVSTSLAVFYWRDWQKGIVPSSCTSFSLSAALIDQAVPYLKYNWKMAKELHDDMLAIGEEVLMTLAVKTKKFSFMHRDYTLSHRIPFPCNDFGEQAAVKHLTLPCAIARSPRTVETAEDDPAAGGSAACASGR